MNEAIIKPVIVKNGIRESTEFNISKDVFAELNQRVLGLIRAAEVRAAANKRKTILVQDI